ncbi:MAG: efflux RND transporter permease subunit [Oscillatoriales cyanobacterium SM2_3_0]|nr:efflux RND transporter permease subunit [Oscillatoriales cyanobacterium SM2_3_0]
MFPRIPWRERLNISRWAIAYPRLTIAGWIAIAIAGLLALSSLKYALFPDVTFPVVVVNATAPVETALATEAQLTQPIEQAVAEIAGLYDLRSTTLAGRTVVSSAFLVGMGLESATAAVRSALNPLTFPTGTQYEVLPLNLNESAAISYALLNETQDLEALAQIAQAQIIPKIAQLPGVLKVNLLGEGTSTVGSRAGFSDPVLAQNPPTLVRFNGKNALAFQVIKRGDANTLEVVNQVEDTINSLRQTLPDITFQLAETQAEYIRGATQSTIDELGIGIVLAIGVIFLFLRDWRATLISAIAIPLSLLGTFMVMAIAGFNLETITLLALALVMGIVVDDAIVDVENIARHLAAGEPPRQAAIQATDEIGLTVSASTLTIVAVFLPVALMGDALGQFFKPFALTISAAVLISLLVARTLSPVLAMYWLKGKTNGRNINTVSIEETSGVPADLLSLTQPYQRLLQWSLGHRGWVIGLAILSLIGGMGLVPLVPQGFLPKLDRGEFNVIYTTTLPNLPGNLSGNLPSEPQGQAAASLKTLAPTEDTSSSGSPLPTEELGQPIPVNGPGASPGGFSWIRELARNPVKFLLRRTRNLGEEIETTILNQPGVESTYTVIGLRGQPNKGKIYVKLKDERQLTTAAAQDQIRIALPEIPDVSVSVEDIQFVETGDEKPLQIVLVGEDIQALTQAAQGIQQKAAQVPGLVDVGATGSENLAGSINQIQHFQRQRAAYVTANLSQDQLLGDATATLTALAQPLLPPGVTLKLTGDSARIGQVLRSFALTLTVSVVLMLGVLLLTFGRFLEPLVVGLSLPLSMVGAMVALLITQSDFGIISVIGLIFLLGLLDKNALLIVDYINQLRRQGLNRTDAILAMGQVRLRPIFMTTLSTILGMLPVALGLGTGSELRQPMAVAIMGGLITSALLSLIVVPVLYTILEDRLENRLKDRRSGLESKFKR